MRGSALTWGVRRSFGRPTPREAYHRLAERFRRCGIATSVRSKEKKQARLLLFEEGEAELKRPSRAQGETTLGEPWQTGGVRMNFCGWRDRFRLWTAHYTDSSLSGR
jgi:hypothetical protein